MAIPVKTRVIDAIVDRVETLSSIASVYKQKPLQYIEETQELPIAFVYDDEETNVTYRGSVRRSQFLLYVFVRLRNEDGRQEISDDLDEVQADLYSVLVAYLGTTLNGFGVRISENSFSKYFDDEYQGGLMAIYTVVYHTNKDSLYTNEYDVNTVLTYIIKEICYGN